MDISVEKNGDVAILKCSGSIDADTIALFKKRTGELFDDGMNKFVLDLTKVGFIDSMGLGAMISLLRRVREKKGNVMTCGVNKDLKDIFEITRLNKLFTVCKDIKEACEKFA